MSLEVASFMRVSTEVASQQGAKIGPSLHREVPKYQAFAARDSRTVRVGTDPVLFMRYVLLSNRGQCGEESHH